MAQKIGQTCIESLGKFDAADSTDRRTDPAGNPYRSASRNTNLQV
jgi:hypothetical protein